MAENGIIGWDLGGAHLKAALTAPDGRVREVVQIPCPLWQGLEHLEAGFAQVLARLGPADRHAVTMTGELVDLFAGRTEGVSALISAATRCLPDGEIYVYAGPLGFLSPEEAAKQPREVASANWLASEDFTARHVPAGLFVDLGSTTADIIPFHDGAVRARGQTDAERMDADELVYTGITRTPLMAVADAVPFNGRVQPLMAEYFATMADVHRLTGALDEAMDQHPAADNGGKQPQDSARRLARMLGRDLEDTDLAGWRRVADYFAEQQRRRLHDACARILSRGDLAGIPDDAPLIGAGIGRFLLRELAARIGRPYRDFTELVEAEADVADRAANCAPAVAVALLLTGSSDKAARTA